MSYLFSVWLCHQQRKSTKSLENKALWGYSPSEKYCVTIPKDKRTEHNSIDSHLLRKGLSSFITLMNILCRQKTISYTLFCVLNRSANIIQNYADLPWYRHTTNLWRLFMLSTAQSTIPWANGAALEAEGYVAIWNPCSCPASQLLLLILALSSPLFYPAVLLYPAPTPPPPLLSTVFFPVVICPMF